MSKAETDPIIKAPPVADIIITTIAFTFPRIHKPKQPLRRWNVYLACLDKLVDTRHGGSSIAAVQQGRPNHIFIPQIRQ